MTSGASSLEPFGAPLPARAATITAHTHLRASGVSKSFGEGAVLRDVSLTARAGDCLAIIGDNGVGKSTLLRILAGTIAPDEGEVHCTTTRSLVDQELVAARDTTVGDLLEAALAPSRDAIARLELATGQDVRDGDEVEAARAQVDAIDAWGAQRRLAADLVRSGVAQPAGTLLAELSPGQRYRLRLACALHVPGGAVLLDEPSNHLDDVALDRLARQIAEHDGIVVLVSHDRWLLARVATSFLDLDPASGGAPRSFRGTFAELRAERVKALSRWRDAHAASLGEEERLEQELARAQSANPDAWRPGKGAGRHGRASRAGGGVRMLRRRLDELVDARPPAPPEPLRFELPELDAAAGALLSATGLTVAGRVHQPAEPPIELGPGGRLLITGPNGAGKSSLLALLAGAATPDGGEVVRGEGARIGWLRQEPASARHATALAFLARYDADEAALRERLLLTGLLAARDLERPMGLLSVGQRQRVALAAVLLAQPSVLLLDEPTNHLSVTLVDELGEALLRTPAAVVLVTHDRALRAATADWPRLELEPANTRSSASISPSERAGARATAAATGVPTDRRHPVSMADASHDQIHDDFDDAVNMTASELRDWLDTDESKEVGQKSSEGAESVGHRSGRRIVEILNAKKADLSDADFEHMNKVVGYVHRHLEQRPSGDVSDTAWAHSLKNWGHDPEKKTS